MERKSSDARIRANTKYNATHTKQYPIRFNVNTDKDIIDKLSQVPNVAGYLKQLIRDDIAKG